MSDNEKEEETDEEEGDLSSVYSYSSSLSLSDETPPLVTWWWKWICCIPRLVLACKDRMPEYSTLGLIFRCTYYLSNAGLIVLAIVVGVISSQTPCYGGREIWLFTFAVFNVLCKLLQYRLENYRPPYRSEFYEKTTVIVLFHVFLWLWILRGFFLVFQYQNMFPECILNIQFYMGMIVFTVVLLEICYWLILFPIAHLEAIE